VTVSGFWASVSVWMGLSHVVGVVADMCTASGGGGSGGGDGPCGPGGDASSMPQRLPRRRDSLRSGGCGLRGGIRRGDPWSWVTRRACWGRSVRVSLYVGIRRYASAYLSYHTHSRAWASQHHIGTSRVYWSHSAFPLSARTHPRGRVEPPCPTIWEAPSIFSCTRFLPPTHFTVYPKLILMYRFIAALSCLFGDRTHRTRKPLHSGLCFPTHT